MVPRREVSGGRKAAFYGGYLCVGIGLLVFVSAPIPFFTNFPAAVFPGSMLRMFVQALVGMALFALGGFLRKVGLLGLAGSAVILDPPKAREDLEPWSRAAGGLVDAAISEVGAAKDLATGRKGAEMIKVRCPSCKALNDEVARYCNQCGLKLS